MRPIPVEHDADLFPVLQGPERHQRAQAATGLGDEERLAPRQVDDVALPQSGDAERVQAVYGQVGGDSDTL